MGHMECGVAAHAFEKEGVQGAHFALAACSCGGDTAGLVPNIVACPRLEVAADAIWLSRLERWRQCKGLPSGPSSIIGRHRRRAAPLRGRQKWPMLPFLQVVCLLVCASLD